jgi:hypothetical protein
MGAPGYSLGTYHPAHLKTFATVSLATVGMHDEAAPRLDETAELTRGSGLLTLIWLWQSRMALSAAEVVALQLASVLDDLFREMSAVDAVAIRPYSDAVAAA